MISVHRKVSSLAGVVAKLFTPPVNMPVLIPIPIPTKGLVWWKAYFNWLFYRRDYWLGQDFHYRLPTGEDIMVPAGFVFDGASIPRFAWFLLSPIGLLLIPGLIHDYAYTHRYLLSPDGVSIALELPNRRAADLLFLEVCHITNGLVILDLLLANILYLTGWIAWRKHRKREKLRNAA